jgi:UDP-GlcNAc:undecaprenyl-phosphate GlcNAc-1-phosphate transferase
MDYPGVWILLGTFGVAFIGTMAMTPFCIWMAPKIGAIDIPKDERRMHEKPMPRFGGLAIFVGVNLALGIFLSSDIRVIGVMLGGLLMYLLGIWDDLRGLPAKGKLLGQIVAALVVCGFGLRIEFVTNHFTAQLGEDHLFMAGAISWVITVLWIVGITNTMNLMDGLDGLASGVAAIASLSIAYTAYIHGYYLGTLGMLALAGGALGFLPYNFHPARIFMGDGGSLFLGFMLATMSMVEPAKGATVVAVMVPVLVLGLPIFDTAFAILRRAIRHRPIMEADKGHLHHRIMAAGMGQQRTVLTMYAISAVMGIAAVLFSRDLFLETGGLFLIAVTLIYIFLTDATVLLPTLKGVNVRKIERRENSEEVQLQESLKEKIEQLDSEEREIEEIQNREGGI